LSALAESPSVSIVIPTRNREQLLQEVIEAVWNQDAFSHITEIVVVDNCSTDGTPQRVQALQQQSPCTIKYHRMPANKGPAHSRNAGWMLAGSDFIVFIDSDVKLDPAWLSKTLAVIKKDAQLGIVGGKLVYASRPDHINSYGGAMGRLGLGWDAHLGEETEDLNEPESCLWVPTAAVLIRRRLLELLSGFDETFVLSYEDSDLGWRANLAGYKCLCIPSAIAYHRINEEPAPLGRDLAYHSCKNRLRSMIKNCGPLRLCTDLPIYLAIAIADVLVRPPRWPKLKGLCWNLAYLPDTIRHRARAQRQRKITDSQIAHLFSPRLLPPVLLGNKRRRLIGAEA
jgi:GT2 family glycosyltransferase